MGTGQGDRPRRAWHDFRGDIRRFRKATTQTPVGAVVLEFEFDAKAERITYTITKRPIIALSSLIWGGIESMIDRCRSA